MGGTSLSPLVEHHRRKEAAQQQAAPTQHTTITNHQARGTTRTTRDTKQATGGPTGKSGKHPTPQLTTLHPSHTHTSLKAHVHSQNNNMSN